MIEEITLQEFTRRFLRNDRRIFLYNRFLNELKIIRQNCFAYQILFIGSFIEGNGSKDKPGDIDVYVQLFTRPSLAEYLPKHRKKGVPIIPFHDFDNFIDIFPIEPIVTNNPDYYSNQEMLDIFNKTNGYNTSSAIVVKEFQKTPMINFIEALDRNGNSAEFIVNEEVFTHKQFKGIEYKISKENSPFHPYFEFKILFIGQDRILVYMINNHHNDEFSGKGIVKAMIKAISESHTEVVVSSTNNEKLKIDETEGRIPQVSQFWNKWKTEMENVSYIEEEDRYIYKKFNVFDLCQV